MNFTANFRVPPVIWWVLLNVNERRAGLFCSGITSRMFRIIGTWMLSVNVALCFFFFFLLFSTSPSPSPPPPHLHSLSDELPDHHKFPDSRVPQSRVSVPVKCCGSRVASFYRKHGRDSVARRAALPQEFIKRKSDLGAVCDLRCFAIIINCLSLHPEAGTVVIATTHDYFKGR